MKQASEPKRILVALIGALIVVAATWTVRHPNDATRSEKGREISSLRADEVKKSRIKNVELRPPIGKGGTSFSIAIVGDDGNGTSLDSLPQTAQRFRLVATIQADRHIASHDYAWILPEKYTIRQGSPVGTIPDLRPGQTFQLTVVIDRGTHLIQPIVLHVYKIINSEPRGQVAQFDIPDRTKSESNQSAKSPQKTTSDFSEERYVQ